MKPKRYHRFLNQLCLKTKSLFFLIVSLFFCSGPEGNQERVYAERDKISNWLL